ncbi:MAG: phosphoribosylamine--glycine ligase [Phycisphaerales bacterium]|nr:phosphoribosylamine--glycine ligase [Phycisphaerales bacterium]
MEPRNFLFVSYAALITDIAWQVAKEGNAVRYCIDSEKDRDIGDGFVEKVANWREHINWADVVVFDDTLGHGALAEELRSRGKLVVGGTAFTDRLEDDRAFGQEALHEAGVHILPYRQFNDFDEAIEFVRTNPDRYVLKPSGEAGNVKRRLFVGEEDDGDDVIRVLKVYKRSFSDVIKEFQLQRRVTGVEVAVGAFFNGREFISPINVNFENKKLFPGNVGPSTGEMGTAMFWSGPNRLFASTLKRLEGVLAREKYVGYIDLNCIVNGQGIYPLEFTARFGYPTIMIQQEGITTPIGEFLHQLAAGTLTKFKVKSGFQIGVRIVVSPFPFDDDATFQSVSRNAAILFKKGIPEEVHIEDVKQIDSQWLVAGTSGVVLVVCGLGSTMKMAQAQAYARIRNIMIPDMYYRNDIGDRWYEDADRLHTWGYLREA